VGEVLPEVTSSLRYPEIAGIFANVQYENKKK
jgi:hypothetical protein